MSAFDYDSQQWIEGAAAVLLRRQQLTEELLILQSTRAQKYLRFIGATCSVSDAIAAVRAELAGLDSHPEDWRSERQYSEGKDHGL